jgi:hypothetical protein
MNQPHVGQPITNGGHVWLGLEARWVHLQLSASWWLGWLPDGLAAGVCVGYHWQLLWLTRSPAHPNTHPPPLGDGNTHAPHRWIPYGRTRIAAQTVNEIQVSNTCCRIGKWLPLGASLRSSMRGRLTGARLCSPVPWRHALYDATPPTVARRYCRTREP